MEFRQFVEAAEDEEYAFKAVFTAGGPGSGKSYLSRIMFPYFMMGDSDRIQVLLSKARTLPVVPDRNHPRYPEIMRAMYRAQELNRIRVSEFWATQGYPIIINTTGRSIEQIQTINNSLKQLGYDTGMVFVRTALDTAIQRNRTRPQFGGHGAEEDYLINAWHTAQANINAFRRIFGSRFVIIDNDQEFQRDERTLRRLKFVADTVIGRPLSREEKKVRSNAVQSRSGVGYSS